MISLRFNATICSIAFLFGLVANVNPCHGQTEFFDTFDGNAEAWTLLEPSEATWSVIDGSYVAVGDANVENEGALSIVEGIIFDDVSVQSTATVLGGAFVGIASRLDVDGGYGGFIGSSGGVHINRIDGDVFVSLGRVDAQGFNGSDEVNLRFDAVGSELSFWAWPMGAEMPSSPTLMATDSTYAQGVVGLGFREFGGSFNGTAFVRDFRAIAVPEPTSTTLLICGLLVSLAARSRTRHSQV